MDLDKLPSNTSYSYASMFYPVGNLRMAGGFSWNPIQPQTQRNHMLNLPEFNVVRSDPMRASRDYVQDMNYAIPTQKSQKSAPARRRR